MRFCCRLFFCLVAISLNANLADSQDLTEDEVITKFLKQSLQSNAVETQIDRKTQKALERGLAIISLDQNGDLDKKEPPDVLADQDRPLVVRYREDSTLDIKVNFTVDSAKIQPIEFPKLQVICGAMNSLHEIPIFRVIGHTDLSGSDKYNLQLSERRATEIGRYFVSECGVAAQRLQILGYGERFPANSEDPFASENRRVEFQALN